MAYIVLDLEFNQAYDFSKNKTINIVPSCRFEIIQIGAIKLDDSFQMVDKINIYIKPVIYKRIHPYVKKITNLSKDFLKDKPLFKDAFDEFKNFIDIDASPVFCVWGSSDLRALYRNLAHYNMIKDNILLKYIDVQNLATKHLKYTKGTTVGLETAIKMLELPTNDTFHNALNDALYTAEVFKKIKPDNIKISVFNSKHVPKK